jgi:hypothetical protein
MRFEQWTTGDGHEERGSSVGVGLRLADVNVRRLVLGELQLVDGLDLLAGVLYGVAPLVDLGPVARELAEEGRTDEVVAGGGPGGVVDGDGDAHVFEVGGLGAHKEHDGLLVDGAAGMFQYAGLLGLGLALLRQRDSDAGICNETRHPATKRVISPSASFRAVLVR